MLYEVITINGSILKYVPIDATKKTGEKTSCMVDFIVFMALCMFTFRQGNQTYVVWFSLFFLSRISPIR